MHIVHEDPHLLVVDKPAGLPTIPDRFGSDSVKDQLEAARGERLWTVHRLDREVSGLLAFARDAETHRTLSMAFERHEVTKEYEALTEGTPPGPPGTAVRWENRLHRGKKRSFVAPHGKEAITDATYVGPVHLARPAGGEGDERDALRWRLRPLTGRNHQLRVHLANAGCPILGDALYGATRPWHDGIALRAVRLALPIGVDLQIEGLHSD